MWYYGIQKLPSYEPEHMKYLYEVAKIIEKKLKKQDEKKVTETQEKFKSATEMWLIRNQPQMRLFAL